MSWVILIHRLTSDPTVLSLVSANMKDSDHCDCHSKSCHCHLERNSPAFFFKNIYSVMTGKIKKS